MPIEAIEIQGIQIFTLKELLRPGLRAVFVGINPALISVDCGHYYQGRLGKRFWKRLQKFGITSDLPEGKEDDAAFGEGIGFTDLVRRPTTVAEDLSREELTEGATDLVQRLIELGEPRPAIVFVFEKVANMSEEALRQAGFQVFRMPGPYTRKEDEARKMLTLANQLA